MCKTGEKERKREIKDKALKTVILRIYSTVQ